MWVYAWVSRYRQKVDGLLRPVMCVEDEASTTEKKSTPTVSGVMRTVMSM